MVHESSLQVVGHFNQIAWNCDLHKGYVMEVNEEATATYNWTVISLVEISQNVITSFATTCDL